MDPRHGPGPRAGAAAGGGRDAVPGGDEAEGSQQPDTALQQGQPQRPAVSGAAFHGRVRSAGGDQRV